MIKTELYRLFFEEASDALLAVDLTTGLIRAVNPTFSGLTGYREEELLEENLSILSATLPQYDTRDRPLNLEILRHPGFYNDILLNTREGSVRYLSVKVRHVILDKKNLALAVLSDDTERQFLVRDLMTKHQSLEQTHSELEKVHNQLKVSQEKMAQAAKLAALGELAAGLSHELNQPLTGIRGFSQELIDVLRSQAKPSKKEVRLLCEDIITNTDKMASLLGHFRNFARQERVGYELQAQPENLEKVDLRHTLEQVLRLMGKRLTNQGIDLKVQYQEEADFHISALPHPIEQVLINLLSNSRDAVLQKNEKQSAAYFHPRIQISVALHNKQIEIRVEDNGCGISENHQSRIFDPFFTTKESGKGTGLGLSISYGIVHRFGGEILLEHPSAPHGTSFVLKFPRFKDTTSRRAA